MKGCDTIFVKKMNLSVVIVALNEESNIERCIKSVQWASEILVYDSGSKDSTVAIAQKLGAKVITGPWLGFGPTKNEAANMATYDWILSLDADEEVSPKLANEIVKIDLNENVAYQIPRLSFYLKHWVRHGGWYPDYQVRLFHRGFSHWSLDLVHESVKAKFYVKLANHLNHYVFKNIEHHIQTNNRYSGLLAQKLFEQGKRFSWFHFFVKPWVKFIECYFIKLGFLDGWVGFFIACGAAYSVLLKWAKLRELELG
ncbi:MAG: hypothetical protein A2622_10875 [Bdellovibrionales bacterium RIFCSPHIGHO2_01_FULL_40_29]|nr:MAG: hypothetical protein A2622_10875 [Bdellovibrionales bacterium RIFCSPHIGHO2_01_FULL_40_29]OFZ34458.1 MAG: hypothetical protein A3D17_01140 [Bdellovibrionales bacterium RIFCSPHIGHO2_02_FULL_40_15]